MAKKLVAIALAVWLTWAAFLAVPANALPLHIVAGGVYGPGGNVAAGTGNPANTVGMVFYSTSQPTYPLLVGADSFTPADGTNPAFFAKDVGTPWGLGAPPTWTNGDNVMVVLEARRGINGWLGPNQTASISTSLSTGASIQDIGDATTAPFPTPVAVGGLDYVNVTWTDLTDANIMSYSVYRSPGPVAPLATLAQGTGTYNNTGLSTGTYCYTLSVNYRRDMVGGVYETSGRSEPGCDSVLGLSPWIVSTNPADAATGVAVNAPIVVTFSEAMNTGTVLYTINGGLTLTPVWSGANTVVTYGHTPDFTACQSYTVDIFQARDPDGNDLVAGPVPNPWTFTATCPNPQVSVTNPASGATQVRTTQSVVVTFSKQMLTSSVTITFVPTLTYNAPTWTGGDTVMTVSHAAFTEGASYQVTVTGTDLLGNSLLPGGAPNPWSFTANRKPVVQITAPGINERRTASTPLTIGWTMSDGTETPVANLRVWLNYTFAGGSFTPIPGAQGLTGLSPPHTFGWTTPASDGDLIVYLEVLDGVGELGQDPSDTVVVDATAPTVSSTVPADGAANVATNADIVITFSEAMDMASAEGAITIAPAVTYTAAWTVGDTVLTLSHAVAFTTNTPYQLRIGVTASDTATPGLGLAAEYVLDFTTGAGPRRPNPPRNFDKTSETASAIGLRWDAPATWTDGSGLVVSDLSRYLIYRSTSSTDTNPTQVGSVNSPTTTFTDSSVVEGTQYYYWVRAVDVNNGESNLSAMVDAKAGVGPTEQFNWLLVLIPLIVILVIVGLFLLMRKKKPEAVPPKEAAVKEEAEEAPAEEPAETAEEPAEEAGKAEEGGEKFVPCPNCGTMVKPADAECFVCGAKL